MTKLSDAQCKLLETASQSGGGLIPATKARPALALVKLGYLAETSSPDGDRLMITEAGRQALAPPADDPAPPSAPEPVVRQTKALTLQGMLRRPEGATIAQMSEVTGWMAHSVRGFLAGHLKKKLGLAVVSEKADGGRIYRLPVDAGASA